MSEMPPPSVQQPFSPQSSPPPGASGTGPGRTDIRPKARWFWIGGAIMLLGAAAAIAVGVVGFFGIASTVDDFARVSPGSDTIRIDSPGDYVVYAEDPDSFGSVDIVDPDGEPVSTSRYSTDLTYDFDGRSGTAAATFAAEAPGEYTITTDADVAIGPSIAGDLVRVILIPFLIGGIGFLVGLIVIIVTAVKRSRSKQRAS